MRSSDSTAGRDGNCVPKRPLRRRRRSGVMAIMATNFATILLLASSPRGVLAQPGSKDWIDPVFTGSGVRPSNDTTIYLSVFLNRLIDVNEINYKFSASFYFYLSWKDENAYKQVADATAAIEANPDKQCERLCNRQKSPAPGALCCDTIWLPTILIRNVDEFPQGRNQPSYVNVSPDGSVSWRLEFRVDLLSTLDLRAYPWDQQALDCFLQILSDEGQSKIFVKPSATGTKLFVSGSGDDLSRFSVKGIRIYTREPSPWSEQFNQQDLKNLHTYSAPDDPAPLVPRPSPEMLAASARARRRGDAAAADAALLDPRAFGSNFSTTDVVVSILITRNSLYECLNIILPVVVCTSISILTFFVEPDKLDTRLQIVITLFLALVAIQFVVEAELPSSSYVLPTRQLVILSYFILLLVALEALVVYNVKSWVSVKQWFSGMKRARRERAALLEAQQRRERERQVLLAAGGSATPKSKPGSTVGASVVPPSAFAPASSSSSSSAAAAATSAAATSSKDPGSTTAAPGTISKVENGELPSSRTGGDSIAPRQSLGQHLSLSLSRSFVPPRGTPWTWRGGAASAAAVAAAAAAPATTAASATPGPPRLARDDHLSASSRRRRREAIERQLDDDARVSWYSWVAWKIDMTSAVALSVVYALVTVLIFLVGVARAPSECELSGQDRALCESAKAALKSHGVDGRV